MSEEFVIWFTSNWAIITPIVLSLIAIIFTALKDFILPAIFRPKINLEGVNDGECIENASDVLNNKSRWVRLRLTNEKGFFRRPAKNCYIKLLSIKDANGNKIMPFNPVPLMWVSYDNFKNNLSIGEYDLIDLVNEYEKVRHLNFKIPIPLELIKQAEKKLSPGKYYLNVGVYGDNFTPIFRSFKVMITNKFGELKFVK